MGGTFNALATCVGQSWLIRVEGMPSVHVRARWRIQLRSAIKNAIAEELHCPKRAIKIRLFIGAPRSNYEKKRAPRPR